MRRLLVTWALAAMVLGAQTGRADSVTDFYKGKRINLIVGYGPSVHRLIDRIAKVPPNQLARVEKLIAESR